ncbi:aminodeoxychorismate lyase [Jeotgalibacillus campisalis]|uniref:4-amino-4-deoxychorismate lyase n=1 Tax=Jeotgalibacillus campisalis TaxID=220754 RepID=A0A0C2RQF0_9BACL|nr:aminodeoxychorismate lyase [Jeotgalibacillus campisalis]KIL52480.1 4-amino-4-deoxychorismate lyase [Jeotgalibacillus campisalis]
MKILQNGAIVEAEDAKISPFDHGFLYGMGVFETFRTYEGHPFLISNHVERLNHSLEEMQIDKTFSVEEVMQMVSTLREANGGKDGYFRLNVSAGVRDIGLFPEPYEQPSVILFQKQLPSSGVKEKKGEWLSIHRNTPETSQRLKSHHYFNNIAARREVSSGNEGLFLTADGFAAEGVTSNLLWVNQKTLFTPALATGILAGITRAMVLALAERAGLEIVEGFFKKEDVLQAEEVFITNSIQEIVPLCAIEHTTFPGADGKWTAILKREYQTHTTSLKHIRDLSSLERGEDHDAKLQE